MSSLVVVLSAEVFSSTTVAVIGAKLLEKATFSALILVREKLYVLHRTFLRMMLVVQVLQRDLEGVLRHLPLDVTIARYLLSLVGATGR